MLISIDASRATVQQRTGTEGYSFHIIRGLIDLGTDHCFHLYFRDTPPDDLFQQQANVEIRVLKQRRLWTHLALRSAVRHERPNVLFVPSHVIPWPDVGPVPSVVTAHDLGYLHYPEKHPLIERLYLDWSTRHSTRLARRVIAVSNATKHDLVQLNGVPAEKIRVVHSGIDKQLRPIDNPQEITALRQRLGIRGSYLLHVGRVQSRKNLPRLVEAFAQIRDMIPDLTLVLAGREVWGHKGVMNRVAQLKLTDRVILPGYVADDDLATLYSGAAAYVFPSLYEGFGFPALEAMACGTPVICANTSSLPELVGDAALTVPPTDVDAFAEAIQRVLTDDPLRHKLIARGLERVKGFTWEAASKATLQVLLDAAGA
jgi:glycosyltransferase involved in cell wall biosynthesis